MNVRKIAGFGALLTAAYGWVLVSATTTLADCSGGGCTLGSPDSLGIPQVSVESAFGSVIGIVSFIAGVLSAIFIIVAGIRYATSSGNSDRIKGAKNTLTYAVIGLIISLLAFAIVGFVTAKSPS
jgi:hypothetical protein